MVCILMVFVVLSVCIVVCCSREMLRFWFVNFWLMVSWLSRMIGMEVGILLVSGGGLLFWLIVFEER